MASEDPDSSTVGALGDSVADFLAAVGPLADPETVVGRGRRWPALEKRGAGAGLRLVRPGEGLALAVKSRPRAKIRELIALEGDRSAILSRGHTTPTPPFHRLTPLQISPLSLAAAGVTIGMLGRGTSLAQPCGIFPAHFQHGR